MSAREKPSIRSLKEHLAYAEGIIRLKLWFLWQWLETHPDEIFLRVLEDRVDIFRKTAINTGGLDPKKPAFDDPRWIALAEEAEKLYRCCRERGDADVFEATGWEIFRSTVEERCRQDHAEDAPAGENPPNAIRYEEPPEGQRPQEISIHIGNTLYPGSIFDDPAYLPCCLLAICAEVVERYGTTTIVTGTWLNSHPRWLTLFPKAWQENLSPPDENIQWHYGFWGQFITARKTLHRKNAQHLRTTGRMPFSFHTSRCSIPALQAHLKDFIANGTNRV